VFRSPSYLEDPDMQDKRTSLKRRRSRRYSRAGVAFKKRKRISPRPKWLRRALYSPFIKVRHPGSDGNNQVSITKQRFGQIQANLNLQNTLTPKYVSNGKTPSLFRQKGMYHSLLPNLPQLTTGHFFRVANWAEPKSKLKGWKAFLLANEFAPYTNTLNANFKKLKHEHVETNSKSKLRDMRAWLWKGSRSDTVMENLRVKQGLTDLPFVVSFKVDDTVNSEATMATLFLNELSLVASQNQSVYQRLNNTILLHRDKGGFMAEKRPELPGLNRGRLLKLKNWTWPEGWSNVALSPMSGLESQWFLKQVHLLRDPSVNDIHSLWQTGKIRKLTTPIRESKQKKHFSSSTSCRETK